MCRSSARIWRRHRGPEGTGPPPFLQQRTHDAASRVKTRVHARAYLSVCAVRFAMDRGGLVGADGATHCGAFDITYMATLPNMIVMAPSDEGELIHMVRPPLS